MAPPWNCGLDHNWGQLFDHHDGSYKISLVYCGESLHDIGIDLLFSVAKIWGLVVFVYAFHQCDHA